MRIRRVRARGTLLATIPAILAKQIYKGYVGGRMSYIAAIAALVITYFVISFAYAELMPFSLHNNLFRERPALLGFLLFLISVVAAVIAFRTAG
jgi:hypothetical protein